MGLRRKIAYLLVFSALIIGGAVFYYRYPHIWGSVAYPLKHEDLILKYSKQYNLSPSLVCALVYTESHFNENATSNVGARGLMQIMPATGARLAKTVGLPNFSTDNLYNPETNIHLGTQYVRELLDRHLGDVTKSLIAYNGGAAAVVSYEKRATIPRETSGFVKKVKDMWQTYEMVYGDRWREEGGEGELEQQKEKQDEEAKMKELDQKIHDAETEGRFIAVKEEGDSWVKKAWSSILIWLGR